MSQHQPYISLDSVINDYLIESEQSMNKYYKIWNLAFRCMEQLGLDFFYRITSAKLPVKGNYTVDIPEGYLNWTKVGVLNNRGEVIPLYYNEKLTTYADLLPERVEKTQDLDNYIYADWGQNTWANYWNGSFYTNIYGVPSGEPFVGSFKVDTENGVILLDEKFSYDYIILEYVSAPTEGQEYYIPVHFREATIAWLFWKDLNAKSMKSNMQLGNKRDWRHEFYNERRNAIARWKPIRQQEIRQASKEMQRLAVKV